MRRLPMVALLLSWLAQARLAQAEHFDIKLSATAGGATQQAFADQTPPSGGLNTRPVLQARAGETIAVQFMMTNVYAHAAAPDAGVRFYLVRERDLGQKAVPALENAVVESSYIFVLKPRARIGAKQQIVIPEPGHYLLRVESQHTQRDHEHFAAIDIEVR